ncbi:uncharacterized protein [Diadema antillarum]|uniref:uncharacterized protein n=1 Tax=Diadema antillarum TaxID=105358 RepID=UPI003A876AE2
MKPESSVMVSRKSAALLVEWLVILVGCQVIFVGAAGTLPRAFREPDSLLIKPAIPVPKERIAAELIQPARPVTPLSKQSGPGAAKNVLDVAEQNSATKFAKLALQTSWLSQTLVNSTGRVTVFAFSDTAFDRSSAALKAALADRWTREAIIQYHVAVGAHMSSDIAILNKDTALYSLFPSPPLSQSTSYQPIHIDKYHVESQGSQTTVVTASGAKVTTPDLMASNGIVHVIDKVMYPVPTGADMARYVQEEPRYSKLYAALEKANLTAALSTPVFKPLTLFAPNDAAFNKLTPDQSKLLQNTTILKRVLTFHVVASSVYRAAMYDNLKLHSLEGSTIYIEVGQGGVASQGQMLRSFDTTVTNGVVHELEGVMFPVLVDHVSSGRV